MRNIAVVLALLLSLLLLAAVAHGAEIPQHRAACVKAYGQDAKAVAACVAMASQYRGVVVVDTQ